jgi:Flp pilus assembly secretin CpaC
MVKNGTAWVLAAIVALSTPAKAAGGEPIEVGAGQSVMLRLDHPARQVVVGDPGVADVSVQSPTLIIVFGKRPGATSLTVLGAGRDPVLETALVVRPGGAATVTVTYGAGKEVKPGGSTVVFACASSCVRAAEEKPGGSPAAKPLGN